MTIETCGRGLAGLLFAAAFLAIGCDTPSQTPNDVIEQALTEALGVLEIPTGAGLRRGDYEPRQMDAAQALGLIRFKAFPDGLEFESAATQKLIDVALNKSDIWTVKDSDEYLGGEPESAREHYERVQRMKAKVRTRHARLADIVNDQEYKGPLAELGEDHRLILGTFTDEATPGAVAAGILNEDRRAMRFRCVVRYSQFTKEWSVIALDMGSIDPERWFTTKVH